MSIVMHHELVADLFGIETRACRAEGTQTHGDIEQSIDTCAQRRQRRCAIHASQCRLARKTHATDKPRRRQRGRSLQQSTAIERAVQPGAPMKSRLPTSRPRLRKMSYAVFCLKKKKDSEKPI